MGELFQDERQKAKNRFKKNLILLALNNSLQH